VGKIVQAWKKFVSLSNDEFNLIFSNIKFDHLSLFKQLFLPFKGIQTFSFTKIIMNFKLSWPIWKMKLKQKIIDFV
jgi:hypothetical protein